MKSLGFFYCTFFLFPEGQTEWGKWVSSAALGGHTHILGQEKSCCFDSWGSSAKCLKKVLFPKCSCCPCLINHFQNKQLANFQSSHFGTVLRIRNAFWWNKLRCLPVQPSQNGAYRERKAYLLCVGFFMVLKTVFTHLSCPFPTLNIPGVLMCHVQGLC